MIHQCHFNDKYHYFLNLDESCNFSSVKYYGEVIIKSYGQFMAINIDKGD